MSPTAKKSNRARITCNVIALGVVSLFNDAASEMIYPLIPIFITFLGSTAVILGIIEGVAETTAAMLKLVSGIISDKIGKRKVLVVIGYGISSLIRPFTGVVSSAWQIVFIRMIDRVGKGIRTAPRDALIASSIDDRIRGKAFGLHRAMDHAGAVIGPLLALLALIIFVLVFHTQDTVVIIRRTFLLTFIPGLLALFTLFIFVQEKAVSVSSVKKLDFSLKQFDKNFLNYLAIVTLFTLGNSSDAFLLFRVQETLHHSNTIYSIIYKLPVVGDMLRNFSDPQAQKNLIDIFIIPLIWAFFHIVKVIFSTHLGALSDKIGRKIVINRGWAIYAFVYLSFALIDRLSDDIQIIMTLILFAIYALYYAFIEGAEKALVVDIVKPEQRGSAFGLFNFATGLAALPASVIFGLLYNQYGALAAFGSGALIAAISMLLLMNFVKEPSKSTDR